MSKRKTSGAQIEAHIKQEFNRRFETLVQWGLLLKDQREVAWFLFHAGCKTITDMTTDMTKEINK